MPKYLIPMLKDGWAVFWIAFLAVHLAVLPAKGADQPATPVTITLDVNNEPLRSVLEKIRKKTRWKITAPDTLLDRPVSQKLHNVPLEEGVRFVLNSAGVSNLFLLFDEEKKTVILFDTESASAQVAGRPAVGPAQPSAVPEPDSRLQRAAQDPNVAFSRASRRARRQSSDDD